MTIRLMIQLSRVNMVGVISSVVWLTASWLHLPWLASLSGWTVIVLIGLSCVRALCAQCALWFYDHNRLSQALRWSQLACLLSHGLYGKKSWLHTLNLDNPARLYQAMGHFEAAKPLRQQALRNSQQMLGLGPEHPFTANCLHNLAGLYAAMGHFEAAEPLYTRALRIYQDKWTANHPHTAACLYDLAELYRDMGRYDAAEPLYTRALDIRQQVLGAAHPDTITSHHGLARLYQAMGRPEAAESLYTHALHIRQQVLPADHIAISLSLHNLAAFYLTMGHFEAAEPLFTHALDICQRVLPADHPDTANCLQSLAMLYVAMGRYEPAEPLYAHALHIYQQVSGVDHPDTANCLQRLAMLYVAMDRYEPAIQYMREGTRIQNTILTSVASAFPEAQVYSFAQTLTWNTYVFLSLVWHYDYQEHAACAAGLDLVLARKAVAYEAAAAQHLTALTDASPALQASFAQLKQARSALARQYMQGPAPGETSAQREQRLHALHEECARLEHSLARQSPAIALQRRLHDADRSAIAQALPVGSTLVEWVRFQPYRSGATAGENPWEPARYMAFLLPAGAPEAVQMIDCGDADAIDLLIARFYWEVAQQKLPPDIEEQLYDAGPVDPCRALYDRVFAPIIAAIDSSPSTHGVPHLIMAPDGALCQLPFGALLSPEQRFVIEDYLISYVTVGRDVVQFDIPAVASGGAVIVADPDYDLCLQMPDETTPPEELKDDLLWGHTATSPQWRTSLERFFPLAGARAEGEAISRLLQDAGVKTAAEWTGRDALEGPLKTLRKAVILHLATHGFFLADPAIQLRDPWLQHRDTRGGLLGDIGQFVGTYGMAHNPLLCSGLVFAGVNTVLEGTKPVPPEAEDGVLTALDVLTMDLHGTELVVLSACQSGQGGILYGEGIVGLRRAFTLVGARTLVLSLWNVPDEETRWLMEHFYTAMLSGQGTLGKAAALRQAQLALLQQLRQPGEEADPRLWAGFICQGDPAPLQSRPGNA